MIKVVLTSPRVAPGLLTRAAWQAFEQAEVIGAAAGVESPSVQAVVGVEPLGRQRLRAVLAAAEKVDVTRLRNLGVGADLDCLHRDAARIGTAFGLAVGLGLAGGHLQHQ